MIEQITAHRLSLTVAIVVCGLVLRSLITRRIRRSKDILTADERQHISTVHYATVGAILITILVLWLPQIQHFMLSITAIAVALVIATKELLLCLLGAMLLRTSKAFSIGDWISVDKQFGEVIGCDFLTTTMQEIESHTYTYTGRTITLPNSLFLANSVINQNFLRRYQFHVFSITIDPNAFPMEAERLLLDRIALLTEPFMETALRYNAMLEKRTGIDIPDAQPSIEFSTNDTARIVTTISIFCPTDSIVELEKSLVKEFFEWYRENRVFPHTVG